jgi:hypothetical protein
MKEEYNSSHRVVKMAAVVCDEEAGRRKARAGARPEPVVGFRKTESEDSLKGVKVVSPFELSPNSCSETALRFGAFFGPRPVALSLTSTLALGYHFNRLLLLLLYSSFISEKNIIS